MAREEKDLNVRLLGSIRLASREKVILSTEENFEELEGHLSIFEKRSEEQNEDEIIGSIQYTEESVAIDMHHAACYTIYIYLPKPRFELLLAAVSRGQQPSEIMIDVAEGGIRYDWQPDGSGKVWDNKTTPELLLKSATFFTPLTGVDTLDERVWEDGMPPSKAQLNELKQSLAELKICFKWLLILVASILGWLLYRLH